MFCVSCGSPISEGQQFCTQCGHPMASPVAQPVAVGAAAPAAPIAVSAPPVAVAEAPSLAPEMYVPSVKNLRCPSCGSGDLNVTGVKGALGKSVAVTAAFGAIGNLVAGSNAAKNAETEPLQYKCAACGNKFVSYPVPAAGEDILSVPYTISFTRQSSFVGAAVPQIVYLNGVKVGPVKNGQTITFQTFGRYNDIFVTDHTGVAFRSYYKFEAQPGGSVAVRFNRKFL